MESKLTLPNLNLARMITEKFLAEDNPHFGQDAFYMFSVSKFILLKERIIKKDSINNILYFDNSKFNAYIPIILDFYKQILKSGNYIRNATIIENLCQDTKGISCRACDYAGNCRTVSKD